MSNFENINFGLSTDIFTSYAPYNNQSHYLPSTIQENDVNYLQPNSFGYFDQAFVPENSHQYFANGHQLSEEGNQVFPYPVLNQAYVPESQIYKVVHAVEYHGTTYFYESLVDFTVYRLCHTTSYTPPHVVDENTLDVYWPGENVLTDNEEQYIENTLDVYWPGENVPTDNEEQYIENTLDVYWPGENVPTDNEEQYIENTLDVYWPGENVPTDNEEQYIENTLKYDYQPSFVESLTTKNNESLSPSMISSSSYSPELNLENFISNNYSNASHVQSQCDLIENYHTITNSAVIEGNVIYGNESTVYYEQVNYGWSHLRNDLSLGRDSVQDPMQAPVLSLEALDHNAIQAHVKYRKDNMYLTALSGKLYQKQTIPVVAKMPTITEVEDEYSMIDCSDKAIENNKSLVQVNACTKYSKKLCRSKSIRVGESLTKIENCNHEDHVIGKSIRKLTKTKQQIDLAVRENIFTNRCKKMYRNESFLFVENVQLIKKDCEKCKVTESSKGILPKMERTYSVSEEKIFVKQTEELIRNQDFREMPVIQEADDEDELEQSTKVNISKIRQSIVQANTFTGRSRNLYRKERYQVFEKMPSIEEIHDEGDLALPSKENVLKRKNSVVSRNIFNDRAKKSYEKESFSVREKMPVMKETENKDYVGESDYKMVLKRKQDDLNAKTNAFITTSMKLHTNDNNTDIEKMPLVQEFYKHLQIAETSEVEELNTDIDKDNDGFLENNENVEKNPPAQENGLLSETIEIPHEENTNADLILHSTDVEKSPVINDERSSLDKSEDIRNNDNILQTSDLLVPAENNTAENTSLSSLSEDVGLEESLETETNFESENEPTKVHSQKPKKKRFQNFRKFLERLLCCCTKGPT